MTPEEHRVFLYGEPHDEDECLCEQHGCRLKFHHIKGWICPECVRDAYYEDMEEMRKEYEQSQAMEDAAMEHDLLHGGSCQLIRGNGWVAFNCKMPWWA